MSATWSLAWAILAVWFDCYMAHLKEPTWSVLLYVLAVWFVIDLIAVTWQYFRS